MKSDQEAYVAEIKESRYEKADLDQVAIDQSQLDQPQKNKFLKMLKSVKNLFLGTQGKWKGEKVSIDLME